jgi:hypothetical protein
LLELCNGFTFHADGAHCGSYGALRFQEGKISGLPSTN